MFIPNTTSLTAIPDAGIDTVTSHKLTATVRRNELLVSDLQRILKEIPAQYQILSIKIEPDKAGGESAITVNLICNESRTLKQDNTIPTPRTGEIIPAFTDQDQATCINDTRDNNQTSGSKGLLMSAMGPDRMGGL